jgi:hypothetical protein
MKEETPPQGLPKILFVVPLPALGRRHTCERAVRAWQSPDDQGTAQFSDSPASTTRFSQSSLTEWGLGCGWSAAPTNHTQSLFPAAPAPLFLRGAAGVKLMLSQSQRLCESPGLHHRGDFT